MYNYIMLKALLLLLCITLFLNIIDLAKPYIGGLLSFLTDRFRSRASVEEPPADAPDEAEWIEGYDIGSFNKRIDELMKAVDEDGIYDLSEINEMPDEPGVEIITDSYEKQLDRRYGN